MAKAMLKMSGCGYQTVELSNQFEQIQTFVGKNPIAIKVAKNLYIIKDEYANQDGKAINEYIEIVRANGVVEGLLIHGDFLIVKTDFKHDRFADLEGDEADTALDLINGNKEYFARREMAVAC